MPDVSPWYATQRASNAAIALMLQRKRLRELEEEYEKRLVEMHEAGVPKTQVCARLVAMLKEDHGVVVKPGDGFSSWSIRQVLDSGRWRGLTTS